MWSCGSASPFPNHNGGLLTVRPRRAALHRPRRWRIRGRPRSQRPRPLDAAGQDPAHRPASPWREAVLDPRLEPVHEPAGRPPRDLLLRAPEPVAVLIRPPDRRPGDRRRRPEPSSRRSTWWAAARAAARTSAGRRYEGFARFNADQSAPNAVPPVLVYSHDQGCSDHGRLRRAGRVARRRSTAATSTATSAPASCGASRRCRGSGRPTTARSGPGVPSLSSFGEDDAGRIYATSLDGPVYRLDPAP